MFTSPPPTWQPRADLGAKWASLGQNVQGFSQADVERVMRGGTKIWRPRFELYDVVGNRVLPDVGGVTAATVDYDDTRAIKGALDITLLADERLRDAFMQYVIRPYAGVGPMPGGALAEFPMGAYVWTKPSRTITGTTGTAETWKAQLGDKLQWFDVGGPGDDPFILNSGGLAVLYLIYLLRDKVGDPDYSGIASSENLVTIDAWYTYVTTEKWTGPPTDQNPVWTPQASQAETWLNIATDLHTILGYAPPCYDVNGVYRAEPDRAWWTDPPDVIYDTASDGVALLPVEVAPDPKVIANRVKGFTQPSSGQQAVFGQENVGAFQALADLNDLLPQHPLAQINCRRYIDAVLQQPNATTIEALQTACNVELFNRLAAYEKVTLKRAGFLAQHDRSGIVGVKVSRDAELRGGFAQPFGFLRDYSADVLPVNLYRETARKLDLFTGDGESTLTRLARTQA